MMEQVSVSDITRKQKEKWQKIEVMLKGASRRRELIKNPQVVPEVKDEKVNMKINPVQVPEKLLRQLLLSKTKTDKYEATTAANLVCNIHTANNSDNRHGTKVALNVPIGLHNVLLKRNKETFQNRNKTGETVEVSSSRDNEKFTAIQGLSKAEESISKLVSNQKKIPIVKTNVLPITTGVCKSKQTTTLDIPREKKPLPKHVTSPTLKTDFLPVTTETYNSKKVIASAPTERKHLATVSTQVNTKIYKSKLESTTFLESINYVLPIETFDKFKVILPTSKLELKTLGGEKLVVAKNNSENASCLKLHNSSSSLDNKKKNYSLFKHPKSSLNVLELLTRQRKISNENLKCSEESRNNNLIKESSNYVYCSGDKKFVIDSETGLISCYDISKENRQKGIMLTIQEHVAAQFVINRCDHLFLPSSTWISAAFTRELIINYKSTNSSTKRTASDIFQVSGRLKLKRLKTDQVSVEKIPSKSKYLILSTKFGSFLQRTSRYEGDQRPKKISFKRSVMLEEERLMNNLDQMLPVYYKSDSCDFKTCTIKHVIQFIQDLENEIKDVTALLDHGNTEAIHRLTCFSDIPCIIGMPVTHSLNCLSPFTNGTPEIHSTFDYNTEYIQSYTDCGLTDENIDGLQCDDPDETLSCVSPEYMNEDPLESRIPLMSFENLSKTIMKCESPIEKYGTSPDYAEQLRNQRLFSVQNYIDDQPDTTNGPCFQDYVERGRTNSETSSDYPNNCWLGNSWQYFNENDADKEMYYSPNIMDTNDSDNVSIVYCDVNLHPSSQDGNCSPSPQHQLINPNEIQNVTTDTLYCDTSSNQLVSPNKEELLYHPYMRQYLHSPS